MQMWGACDMKYGRILFPGTSVVKGGVNETYMGSGGDMICGVNMEAAFFNYPEF